MHIPTVSKSNGKEKSNKRDYKKRLKRNKEIIATTPKQFIQARLLLKDICDGITFESEEEQTP